MIELFEANQDDGPIIQLLHSSGVESSYFVAGAFREKKETEAVKDLFAAETFNTIFSKIIEFKMYMREQSRPTDPKVNYLRSIFADLFYLFKNTLVRPEQTKPIKKTVR